MKQTTPAGLSFLDQALERERQRHLLRERSGKAYPPERSFCSNDYLALCSDAATPSRAGAGASRLVSGDLPVHAHLEEAAAELVGQPAALSFTSGYAANVGLLSALAGPGDLLVSDALNHASIIDGARLARARVVVVPHRDVGAVEAALRSHERGRAFVVTESYFSMDADSPDLRALRDLCSEHGAALIVDEAHALGVLGPDGRGLSVEANVQADAVVGTFGKAFGAAGAFVAGCPALIAWLWNRARSFVFSTGLSPTIANAALSGLAKARQEPARRHEVGARAAQLRAGLARLGIPAAGYGHIVPWVIGDPGKAFDVARALRDGGFDVCAIRPPSVPPGTARLRLTVSAAHRSPHVEALLEAVEVALRGSGR